MAPETNWLPFVLRETLRLDTDPTFLTGGPTAAQLGSFGMGKVGDNVLLQDFGVEFGYMSYVGDPPEWTGSFSENIPEESDLLMRYGYKHRGYLIDVPVTAGAFATKGKVFTEAWNFLRPYRIYPGEVMRARFRGYRGEVDGKKTVIFPRKPGMMFNGVRTKDKQPHLLYSTTNEIDEGEAMVLNQAGFTCPGDSPVDIWGVSAFGTADAEREFVNGPDWQIIGPDEREWFRSRIDNDVINVGGGPVEIQDGTVNANWLAHRWASVELGEGKGWMMGRDETFVVELGVNTPLTNDNTQFWFAMVTLRGFMEVNHG